MIKHLVVWGGKNQGLESHRWIHKAFHENAGKLGILSTWCGDRADNAHHITPGCTVISADVYGENLPYVEDVDYVLHNFSAGHRVLEQVEPERLLRLQVWTTDASGETWDVCRQFDREARTLFQPWGSDLLAEEFLDPVFNPQSREVVFVGAIWGEKSASGELGNEAAIGELRAACADLGLNFRHLTHVSDMENMAAVRSARLAPTIVGGWQIEHGYLPCRAFKNPAYGTLMFTNSPQVQSLFAPAAFAAGSVRESLSQALTLRQQDYLDAVHAQQRVCRRYTYRESIQAIERALEEGRG